MRLTVPQEQHAQRLLKRACARCLLAGLALAATLILLSSVAIPYPAKAAPPVVAHRTLTTGLARTDALTSTAADIFMHALMTRNGQLAWQQLCSDLQRKLPASALMNLANAQGAAGANPGVKVGLDYVGSHVWSAGGEIRVYVITAHWPSGEDVRALYVLRTQASGCIDGILGG
jgi:hypothetical protein